MKQAIERHPRMAPWNAQRQEDRDMDDPCLFETRHSIALDPKLDMKLVEMATASGVTPTETLRRFICSGLEGSVAQAECLSATMDTQEVAVYRAVTLSRKTVQRAAKLAAELASTAEDVIASIVIHRLVEDLAA